MDINYAEYAFDVTNLGPGSRSVLWVQGCPFNCTGCIAPSHRGVGGHHIEVGALARIFESESDSRELTISGGEPMLQAEALAEFIDELTDDEKPGIIIYTGYKYEELMRMSSVDINIKKLLEQTDLLIDGGYVADLDRGEIIRGSENQQMIYLTDRYKTEEMSEYMKRSRAIEIRFKTNDVMMIGIPNKSQARQWEAAKNTINGIK